MPDVEKIFKDVNKEYASRPDIDQKANPLDEINRRLEEDPNDPNGDIFKKDQFQGKYVE